jgi:hypothetical protein
MNMSSRYLLTSPAPLGTSATCRDREGGAGDVSKYRELMFMLSPKGSRAGRIEFPVLANVARATFSISASGAGAERLFNCARNICVYRRSMSG